LKAETPPITAPIDVTTPNGYVLLGFPLQLLAMAADRSIIIPEADPIPTPPRIDRTPSPPLFGEISLITDRPRNVTARAASKDVSVIKITKSILENFEKTIQMKVQKQLILKLAENLDNMNSECFKLKSFIKKIKA